LAGVSEFDFAQTGYHIVPETHTFFLKPFLTNGHYNDMLNHQEMLTDNLKESN